MSGHRRISASATRSRTGRAAGGSDQSQSLYAAGDANWNPRSLVVCAAAAEAARAGGRCRSQPRIDPRLAGAEVALERRPRCVGQQRLAIVRASVAGRALQITRMA